MTSLTIGSAQRFVSLAVAAIGAAASFVLTTVLMDQVPDVLLLAVALGVASACALALLGPRQALRLVRELPREALLACAGGASAFFVAPVLVLSQRASDAPSGSVVIFLTTSLWGLVAALSWWVARPRAVTYLAPVGAFASVVGAAAVLANWERPSSFSPFVKFPVQELTIVGAGILFVAGSLVLTRAARPLGTRATTLLAVLSAAALALALGLPSAAASATELSRLAAEFVLLGLATYALVWGWVSGCALGGVALSAPALLTVPVLLTLLSILERTTGVYGPNPILWRGAVPGMVVCMTGAAVTYLSGAPAHGAQNVTQRSRLLVAIMWIAGAALIVGVALLAFPALRAHSVGILPEVFEVTWTMRGFEAAASWLPLVSALLVVTGAALAPSRATRAALLAAGIAAVAAAVAYPFLLDTPLHTWNNWIPSDVQQTYGTEYARFTVQAIRSPLAVGALIASSGSALGLMIATVMNRPVEEPT